MSGKRIVTYVMDDGQEVSLTVCRATALMGMQRSIAAYQGAVETAEETNEAVRVLRTISYPDLTACTNEVVGIHWPISFDEFCGLPDDLIARWEQAVYEVNPHWSLAGQTEPVETREKKVATSTGD